MAVQRFVSDRQSAFVSLLRRVCSRLWHAYIAMSVIVFWLCLFGPDCLYAPVAALLLAWHCQSLRQVLIPSRNRVT